MGFLLGSVGLLVMFVGFELRSRNPMLDLTLFRKPTFVGVSAAAFTLSASMFAMFLYLTLFMQNILGYGPLDAGLRFLPVTVVSFFAAPAAGRLSDKIPPRVLMSTGLALVAVALFLMHGVKVDSSWTTLLAGFVLAGIGVGILNPIMAQTAIGVVPPTRSKVRSCNTRKSLICMDGGTSPTSSRKMVPPSACSKRPLRWPVAPV